MTAAAQAALAVEHRAIYAALLAEHQTLAAITGRRERTDREHEMEYIWWLHQDRRRWIVAAVVGWSAFVGNMIWSLTQ